jgi:hypothetical protein
MFDTIFLDADGSDVNIDKRPQTSLVRPVEALSSGSISCMANCEETERCVVTNMFPSNGRLPREYKTFFKTQTQDASPRPHSGRPVPERAGPFQMPKTRKDRDRRRGPSPPQQDWRTM